MTLPFLLFFVALGLIGWLGWFGAAIVAAVGLWIGWSYFRDDTRRSANSSGVRTSTRYANAAGYERPRDPRSKRRKYGNRYKAPYTNWRTVARREKYICHLCGMRVDEDDFTRSPAGDFIAGANYPTVDHLLPKSRGGSNHWTNLKLAHLRCNSAKSTRTPEEFAEKQARTRSGSRKGSHSKRDAVEELIRAAAKRSPDSTFTAKQVKELRDASVEASGISDSYLRACLSSFLNVGSAHCVKPTVESVSRGVYKLLD